MTYSHSGYYMSLLLHWIPIFPDFHIPHSRFLDSWISDFQTEGALQFEALCRTCNRLRISMSGLGLITRYSVSVSLGWCDVSCLPGLHTVSSPNNSSFFKIWKHFRFLYLMGSLDSRSHSPWQDRGFCPFGLSQKTRVFGVEVKKKAFELLGHSRSKVSGIRPEIEKFHTNICRARALQPGKFKFYKNVGIAESYGIPSLFE